MKDYDPMVFLAVFQEMLGPLLWLLPLAALATVAALVWVVRREGVLVSRRLVRAQLVGLVGGGLALVLMALVSSSGFTDAAGPADWILIALVYATGFVAATVVAYTGMGLLWPRLPRTAEA